MNNSIVLLDSGPLGWVIHSKSQKPDVVKCRLWFRNILNNYPVFIPEITDYEVRRELIHQKLDNSLKRLDNLKSLNGVSYLPITTEIMNKAAQLWGWARSTGQSTAQSAALDGDVILAILVQTSLDSIRMKIEPLDGWIRVTFIKLKWCSSYITCLIRRNASAVGYRLISCKACRSNKQSALLNRKIRVVVLPQDTTSFSFISI